MTRYWLIWRDIDTMHWPTYLPTYLPYLPMGGAKSQVLKCARKKELEDWELEASGSFLKTWSSKDESLKNRPHIPRFISCFDFHFYSRILFHFEVLLDGLLIRISPNTISLETHGEIQSFLIFSKWKWSFSNEKKQFPAKNCEKCFLNRLIKILHD